MLNILFICTGNYYRSRFAEIYFDYLAGTKLSNARANSRGFRLNDRNLGELSLYARERLEELGIPFNGYQRYPEPLTIGDLTQADVAIAMHGEEHIPFVRSEFPEWIGRVRFWDVPDLHLEPPGVALPRIEREVRRLIEEMRSPGL